MKLRRKSKYLSLVAAILVFLINFSCIYRLSEKLNERIVRSMSESLTLKVFFLTNREKTSLPGECSDRYFTIKSSNNLHFGSCAINVPKKHSIGAIDQAGSGDYIEDKHFIASKFKQLESPDFLSQIRDFPGEEMLLFVHGFNVKFQEAIFRTAQIGYDSKFQGPIILFTWPAGSASGFLAKIRMDKTYSENQENARQSIPVAMNLIKNLSKMKKKLHIIVHSMGHQVILPAIELLLTKEGEQNLMSELILNAPDFSAEEFKRIAPLLQKSAGRITLYCSPGDNALRVSMRMNNGRRIGQCEKVSGVDVINVNEIADPVLGIGGLGHGYYSGRAILTDISQILLGIKAEKRLFLRRSSAGSGEHFVLRR